MCFGTEALYEPCRGNVSGETVEGAGLMPMHRAKSDQLQRFHAFPGPRLV